jgi:hypothetical protein
MSWHTSAIAIQGDHAGAAVVLLDAFGLPGLARVGQVDGDTAGSSSLEGVAVGVASGWTLLWDPTVFLGPDPTGSFGSGLWPTKVEDELVRLSQRVAIYSFTLEGTSGTCGFAWYQDGRRQRLWLAQEGNVILQEGPELPQEAAAMAEERDDEQRIFLLMHMLTGVAIGETMTLRYALYA